MSKFDNEARNHVPNSLPLCDGIGACCVILWKPHELVCWCCCKGEVGFGGCDCGCCCNWPSADGWIPCVFGKKRLPVIIKYELLYRDSYFSAYNGN